MSIELILFILAGYIIIRYVVTVVVSFTRKIEPVDSSVSMSWDYLFSSRIPFYKHLDEEGKDKFINRVHEFMKSKRFVGFNDFEVLQEHRLLISACGVQLTFGLEEFTLSHIDRIFIAPGIFFSRLINRDVKGLTVPNAIYLSWEDCKKGMDVRDDALNLCLHEFAHALEISTKLKNADTDYNYEAYLEGWEEASERALENMNRSKNDEEFLREYAGENKHEFFAVSVEYFFERSADLKKHKPEIYTNLCQLLNLDPLNFTGNYSLVEGLN